MPDRPLTRDDVLNAHEWLKDYSGDFYGLLSEPDRRFTEWKLYAVCGVHGEVTNTISTPAYQTAPAAPHVVCPGCLAAGFRVNLAPKLVVKTTWEEGSL